MSDVNEESNTPDAVKSYLLLRSDLENDPLVFCHRSEVTESLRALAGGCCIKDELEQIVRPSSVTFVVLGFMLRAKTYLIKCMIICMNVVLGSVNNFVYYCETNNCTSRIKQLLFNFFTGNSPTGNSTSIAEPAQSQIATQQNFLSEQLNDFTHKNC